MKWIELTSEYDGKPVGEQLQIEDGVADALVKSKTAKSIAEPKAVTDAGGDDATESLRAMVQEEFGRVLSTLSPKGKRFSNPVDSGYDLGTAAATKIPAHVRRCGSLKNFANDGAGEVKAYRFGMWFKGVVEGSCSSFGAQTVAREWCKKNGINFLQDIDAKGNVENNNTAGGFLVPVEFDTDLIDLREKYGVFRKYCNSTPMQSDTKVVPRRKNGVTGYFTGEGTAGTESTKNWDQVQLVAKKLMALTRYSNELGEDAMINIGDDLAGEIAYAFALKEDQCGFIGDGSSTYGGIQGVTTKLKNVDATIANILGLTVSSGTGYASSYGSITLGDFNKVVGNLPEYADGPNAKWYVHKSFWGSTMQRLATAAGGNKIGDIVDGARVKEFLGYEVVVSQVMPKTPATNQVVAILGDLSKSTSFGDRRMTSIKVSDSALNAFEQDQLIIRGTERFDIVVHDVGESSAATPRDTNIGAQAGPIVGLITAGS